MVRISIDIDEDLLRQVLVTYGLRTPAQGVDLALRRLVIQPMERGEALALEGTGWAGDLDEMRTGTSPRG